MWMPAVTAGTKYLPKADGRGSTNQNGQLTNKGGRPTTKGADRPQPLADGKETRPVASCHGR